MYMKKLSRQVREGSDHIEGQFIVKFRSGALQGLANVEAPGAKGAKSLAASLPESISGPLAALEANFGAISMKSLFARKAKGVPPGMGLAAAHKALVESVDEAPRESLEGFQLVRVAKSTTETEVRKRLKSSPAVEFVEPVPNRWLAAADPMLNRQWGLRAIKWFNGGNPDAKQIHVAVLDSGIDNNHPDLAGSIEAYHHEGNAARDYCGHGTHVAGTIAALINNGVGIAGIANCRLHCWKIFDDNKPDPLKRVGPFDFEYYASALGSLLEPSSKIKVVNLSIGGPANTETEAALFRELRSAGILVAAAMGNEYEEGNPISYPAAYDGVLAVGAVDEADRRGTFSCTGEHIQLAAPGVNVLSTIPTLKSIYGQGVVDYDSWPGTSMATPHVAGCSALVYAKSGGKIDARAVEGLLVKHARKVPSMNGKNFTEEFGFGVVSLDGVFSSGGGGEKKAKPKAPKTTKGKAKRTRR